MAVENFFNDPRHRGNAVYDAVVAIREFFPVFDLMPGALMKEECHSLHTGLNQADGQRDFPAAAQRVSDYDGDAHVHPGIAEGF